MKSLSKPVCVLAPIGAFLVSFRELDLSQASRLSPIFDTGPPAAKSFTESVLQRSILAHAPPLA